MTMFVGYDIVLGSTYMVIEKSFLKQSFDICFPQVSPRHFTILHTQKQPPEVFYVKRCS